VVVQEPVLQDLVGRHGVWVCDDVLDETERVLAECLDDVKVAVLLGLQVLQLKIGLQLRKPRDRISNPKLRKSEGSAVDVLHSWSLNDRLRVLVIHDWITTDETRNNMRLCIT
jgi:hypothetical protein